MATGHNNQQEAHDMITVWYMDKEMFHQTFGGMEVTTEKARKAMNKGRYAKAAEVATDDLNEAYRLMQNGVVSDSWTLDPPAGVKPLLPPIIISGRVYGNRSASTGDILEHNGKFHLVADVGFQVLPE